MKKLIAKIGVGIATVGLLTGLLAPVALADNEISGNGDGSTNTITTTVTNNCTVKQSSKTDVWTKAKVSADSGGNSASSNTGGDVSIDTGTADASMTVTVTGGSNSADNPCCPCQETTPPSNLIAGNGDTSTNGLTTTATNTTSVTQKTKTKVKTRARVRARSGHNTADGNTGTGPVSVTTDAATSSLDVTVTGGGNTL